MHLERWENLFALAEAQHGAFTTAQAEALQIDAAMLARARRDRLIDRLRPRVHAVLSLIDDDTVLAGIQLAHPRAVASRRAAAIRHRYDGILHDAADVAVPPNLRLRGPTVHRVTDLVVPEIVVIDGIRCTDEIRTLCDLPAVCSRNEVERAVESLLRRRPEAEALLHDRASALARKGKSGPGELLRILDGRPDAPTGSDLETVYWQCLREHGVDLPIRQHPVGQYRLDNAFVREKVFVELDGYATHGSREAFGSDRRRQNVIVSLGWVPLRFTDSDVRHHGRRTATITERVVLERRRLLVA